MIEIVNTRDLLKVDGVKHSSFLAIFTKHAQPWLNYTGAPTEIRNITMPAILMVRNFSGRLGFPGGNVDEKNVDNIDVLKETALREAKEEIGFDVLKGQSVDLLCSHYVEGQKGASATHLFTVEVRSFSDIIKIQAQSHRGCDFGSEIVSVEQIRPDRQMKDPDFKSIFNAQLAKTCAEEMIELWHHVDFVDQDEIERIRRMHVPIYKKS